MGAHHGKERQAPRLRPRYRSGEEALGVGVGAQDQHIEVGQRLVGQTQDAVLRHVQLEPRRGIHLGDERAHAEPDQFFRLIHGSCLSLGPRSSLAKLDHFVK